MAASRPNRASGTAGRRISGSPRSSRRPPGRGARRWRATARRPHAARSRATSPCAPTGRRRRARWRAASGRCATPGIARPKTCSRPGSRSCSTRRSTRSCRGRRCTKVLRDRSRNLLFNHLGLGEDEMKMVLRPDCADLPYFLRAYFAFKMGLPFGYSKCTRGGGGRAPTCPHGSTSRISNRRLRPRRSKWLHRARPRRGNHRADFSGTCSADCGEHTEPACGGSAQRAGAQAAGARGGVRRLFAGRSATAFIPDRRERR